MNIVSTDVPGEFHTVISSSLTIWIRVTRGHPPVVAIAEAMHYAERIGFSVIEVHACWLPCDFMAISEGKITLVRVRRLRYAHYGLPDIVASCTQEILELRSTPVAEDTGRELFGSGTGQALAPVCHFPGQGRNCGDVRHVSIPSPGTADASCWVNEEGERFFFPYYPVSLISMIQKNT